MRHLLMLLGLCFMAGIPFGIVLFAVSLLGNDRS